MGTKIVIQKPSCTCTHANQDVHENRTKTVLFISVITMLGEIVFGYLTNSMALLSDGWHMFSHVMAMGLTWLAYAISRKNRNNRKFKTGTNKILSLSGYTSGILLLLIAVWMAIESACRFFFNEPVLYGDAMIVAITGLIVNLICAFILQYDRKNHDDNIKAAYIHILSDALTSLLAIVALYLGKIFEIAWFDALGGIIGSMIIIKWSLGLLKQSGAKLLDYEID